jgi:putative phage-type endonuclease
MFITVDHDQGRGEWLAWRHGGIGASDAPALMGENPWKSERRLFAEKCAPPKVWFARTPPRAQPTLPPPPRPEAVQGSLFDPPKPRTMPAARPVSGGGAMARGNALEPYARALFAEQIGVAVEPLCLESTGRPWQRASLDGIDVASRRVVEIKCGDKVYAHTAATGTVPGYYVGQLQHILCVTGFDAIDFWVWLPGLAPLHLIVPRDDAYIARMTDREAAFWDRVEAARG